MLLPNICGDSLHISVAIFSQWRYAADKFLIAFSNQGIPHVIVTWNLLDRNRIVELIWINRNRGG